MVHYWVVVCLSCAALGFSLAAFSIALVLLIGKVG